MPNVGIKVYAPATVANVAVGYDILGFAIHGPGDDIIIRPGSKAGLHIDTIHNGRKLPKEVEKNTAGVAALSVLEHLGIKDYALEMEIFKKMPFASGMGSSAASAVAGAYAVNAYYEYPLEKIDLLPHVMKGEMVADGAYHADNVGPSLLGGILLIRNNEEHDVIKLPSPEGLYCCLIHPNIKILTAESRAVLSEQVSLEGMIQQTGNIAAFVAALYRTDLDLLERCLEDVVIEPQRAKLIPHFYEMKKIALQQNALGFSISGAGPSLFALCRNSLDAENIGEQIHQFLKDQKIESTIYISTINNEGAIKY